jgi:hypothetical protein
MGDEHHSIRLYQIGVGLDTISAALCENVNTIDEVLDW